MEGKASQRVGRALSSPWSPRAVQAFCSLFTNCIKFSIVTVFNTLRVKKDMRCASWFGENQHQWHRYQTESEISSDLVSVRPNNIAIICKPMRWYNCRTKYQMRKKKLFSCSRISSLGDVFSFWKDDFKRRTAWESVGDRWTGNESNLVRRCWLVIIIIIIIIGESKGTVWFSKKYVQLFRFWICRNAKRAT